MSESPLAPDPPEVLQERFQEAWLAAVAGGSPPYWGDFLPLPDQYCPPDFLLLLLQTDIEYRLRLGETAPLVDSYLQHARLRAGDLRLEDEQLLEVIRWEYAQRWKRGERARRTEYLARFPHLAD